jgi:hypothetical protein
MIERVARAIYETEPYGISTTRDMPWADVHESQKEGFRIKARAAIEAMREPTDGMHEAAEEISVYYDDFSCGDGNITLGLPGYREKFNQVWQKLITAALEETQ